jgi:recombination protein RecT
MKAAMKAATLNLAIEPSLGFAYIVPYGNNAQFQLGYKGLIQLAIRSVKSKISIAVSFTPVNSSLTTLFLRV